jgi:hypothetical protein
MGGGRIEDEIMEEDRLSLKYESLNLPNDIAR